jgi:hypothetical protein
MSYSDGNDLNALIERCDRVVVHMRTSQPTSRKMNTEIMSKHKTLLYSLVC